MDWKPKPFDFARWPLMARDSYAAQVAIESHAQWDWLVNALQSGRSMPAIEAEMGARKIPTDIWREWVRVIMSKWREDDEVVQPFAKDRMRATLWNAFSSAYDQGNMREALKALDQLCKLDGLYDVVEAEKGGVGYRSAVNVRGRLRELMDHPKVKAVLDQN